MTNSKSIILTGGAGFIGSHVYAEMSNLGYKLIIIDNFSNSKKDVIERLKKITTKDVNFYDCDCTNLKKLCKIFKKEKPSAVIHFAALKSVSESKILPLNYYNNNLNSLICVLECMKLYACNKIIFSSSATVYDKNNILPLTEKSNLGYSNPYGHTKLICEQIIQEYKLASDINYGILRYFNPVGAHVSGLIGEDPQGIPNNLMPYVAKVATGELESVNIYGNNYDTNDGTGVRDYIHIDDLVAGHLASLNYLTKQSKSHIINLGTGKGNSVLEVINKYREISNKDIIINNCERRDGDIAECYADCTKAKEVLGWEAKHDLDDMCSSSWKWVSSD